MDGVILSQLALATADVCASAYTPGGTNAPAVEGVSGEEGAGARGDAEGSSDNVETDGGAASEANTPAATSQEYRIFFAGTRKGVIR